MLTLYVDEIIGDHQCEFRRSISTVDHIFCMHQIMGKNGSIMGQYISYLYTLRTPLTQARSIIQYSHRIGNAVKLIGIIKMCLN
jgi:hypothetical protein